MHRLLHPLDAEAHRPQARRCRTSGSARKAAAAVALVAEQPLDLAAVAVEMLVVAQRDGAGRALGHEAAVAALHEAGRAAAIEEQDGLLALLERLVDAAAAASG